MCTGFTQSFAGLLACRILLGLCEAGFLPGSPPHPPSLSTHKILCHAKINMSFRMPISDIYVLSSVRVAETIHAVFLFYCDKRRFWWRKCSPMRKINVDEYMFIDSNSHIIYSYKTIAFCVCDSKYVRRRRLWRMALDFHSGGSYHNYRRPRLLSFHCRLAWEGKVPQRPRARSATSPNTWGWTRSDNGSFWQEIRSPRFWWLENLHWVRDYIPLYIEKRLPCLVVWEKIRSFFKDKV